MTLRDLTLRDSKRSKNCPRPLCRRFDGDDDDEKISGQSRAAKRAANERLLILISPEIWRSSSFTESHEWHRAALIYFHLPTRHHMIFR